MPEVVEDRGAVRSIGSASSRRRSRRKREKTAKARCRVPRRKCRRQKCWKERQSDGSRAKGGTFGPQFEMLQPFNLLWALWGCKRICARVWTCLPACPPVLSVCARPECVSGKTVQLVTYTAAPRGGGGVAIEQTKQRQEPELGGGTCCCSDWLLHLLTHI